MSKLNDAKKLADNYLDEVEATIEIRQTYTNVFVPMSGILMGALGGDRESRARVQRALKFSHVEADAAFKPLVVQVCGIFESYVRSVTQAVIEDRFETADSYWDLSEGFRNDHITHAARVLGHLKKGDVMGAPYPFDALLRNLGKGLSGQKGYKLNPEVFTKLMGNPTSARLEDLFASLSLPKPFSDELGQFKALQDFFNEKTRRRVATNARTMLDAKLDLRNDIVHGDLTRVVDQTEIEQTLGFFRALIAGFDQLLQA